MQKKWPILLTNLLTSFSFGSTKPNLIIDHDAGVDDLASIAIAILSDRLNVRLITICPDDSFKAPAIPITLALVKFLGAKNIEIAAGDNEGVNSFPEKWRADSIKLSQIEELKLSEFLVRDINTPTDPSYAIGDVRKYIVSKIDEL